MAPSRHQQRLLPANRIRVEVRATDGSQLTPTTPQRARVMVRKGAARFHLDRATGRRWLQMVTPCGTTLPPVMVQPGTALPLNL